ncbi:MAG: rhodanese-like domain-containing protein [Phycisphaerales bacterium]|nr:rhodanese-like domain-containing protein [Planctomycetota bacterium]MCH8507924.1 rhodanese-like domain-containing protein [Phycisphaerales bacterium]
MTQPSDLPDNPPRWPFNPELEISVTDTRDGLAGGGVVLVDIREPEELAIASVPGAVHIPMDQLAARANEMGLEEDQTLALICHTGRRSLAAAMALQRMGLDEARSVAGGIEWWSVRIDPSVPRY